MIRNTNHLVTKLRPGCNFFSDDGLRPRRGKTLLAVSIFLLFFAGFPFAASGAMEASEDFQALTRAVEEARKEHLSRPLPPIPDSRDAGVDAALRLMQKKRHKNVQAALNRFGLWRNRLLVGIRKNAMPEELLALVFVESAYKPKALSPSDAAGFWQILPTTARFFDLRRDAFTDERLDPEKATDFACWYLRELYAQFQDWHLALAAYNGGRGTISRLLASGAPKSFFLMRKKGLLRAETADYTPKILAAWRILKNPREYGFTPPRFHQEKKLGLVLRPLTDILKLEMLAGVPGGAIAKANPGLRGQYTPPDPGGYRVVVPKKHHQALEKADLSKNAVADRTRLRGLKRLRIKVKGKMSLWGISRRYDTCLSSLRAWNGLSENQGVGAGDVVIVYIRDDFQG